MSFYCYYLVFHINFSVLSSADKDMDAAGALEKYKTKISLSYDGNNSWMAPAMFQSICKIDIKYFPFDEQHCYMKFASWAYDVSMLDVYVNYQETGILKGIYQPSNEWDLISVVSERNEVCLTFLGGTPCGFCEHGNLFQGVSVGSITLRVRCIFLPLVQ